MFRLAAALGILKNARASGLLLLIALAASSCRYGGSATDPDLPLTLEWSASPSPARKGPVELTLRPFDSAGRPVLNAAITVQGNMTHPGMVPVLAKAESAGKGVYLTRIELSMAGDWIFSVEIAVPGKGISKKKLDLPGVM